MIESFVWSKDFETGMPSVDEQHHRLVDLVNRFSEQVMQQNVTSGYIASLLDELSDYTHYHFREEEGLMEAHRLHPEFVSKHKEVHEGFIKQLAMLQDQVHSDAPYDWHVLLNFLYQWLGHHILGQDQSMARQYRRIEQGEDPGQAWALESAHHEQDSIEPLLHALSGMMEMLVANNAQIRSLNLSLEQKVRDRTRELEEANAKLEALSLTDVLTGLPNRRHAMQKLVGLWKESVSSDKGLACMMIDADNFKEVNDEHGHDAGDRVLLELARTLREETRTDDFVCRLGGDEFFVICPHTDLAGARHLAEQLLGKVRALRVPTGNDFWRSSISVGLAGRTAGMATMDDLMKLSDDSLYQAKRDGKGCVRAVQQPLSNTAGGEA